MSVDPSAWGFAGHLGSAGDAARSEDKIEAAGWIPADAFKIAIGIILGAVVIALGIRTVFRIRSRSRFRLDDGFLVLAFVGLCTSCGILLANSQALFTAEALAFDETFVITRASFEALLNSLVVVNAFHVIIWTSIYAAKVAILSLFAHLVRRVSRALRIYFWGVVVISGICWAFVVVEPFIVCPKVGLQSAQCDPAYKNSLSLVYGIVLSLLDVATDALIISIPTIILRKACMKGSQKLSLAAALALSAIALATSLIRLAPFHSHRVPDVTWTAFFLYLESAILIAMGCLPALRSLFILDSLDASPSPHRAPRRGLLFRRRPHRPAAPIAVPTPRDMEALRPSLSTPRSSVRTSCRRAESTLGSKSLVDSEAGAAWAALPPLPLNKDEIYINRVFQISSKRATPEI